MAGRKSSFSLPSELRQDPVSQDWIAIATARAKRPDAFADAGRRRFVQPVSSCPFETLHADALLAYTRDGDAGSALSWWVQVIPNKYPAFDQVRRRQARPAAAGRAAIGACAVLHTVGPYQWTAGIGFHEVVITRDHTRSLAAMRPDEAVQVIRSYQERAIAARRDPCVRYISVFHNHGRLAGATVSHPHSQIIALPVIPPDVARSIRGSAAYFTRYRACAHCAMLKYELKNGDRMIYENDHCVALAPYASKTAFEMRIFPKKHRARFEESVSDERGALADALRISLAKLAKGLINPDYNFFIHTAPVGADEEFGHYHWHLEIVPKTVVWAGFEIGTGIEISAIAPETAAKFLRKVKVLDAKI